MHCRVQLLTGVSPKPFPLPLCPSCHAPEVAVAAPVVEAVVEPNVTTMDIRIGRIVKIAAHPDAET